MSRGLVAFDESSLAGALAAAAGERHDTDGDGIPDVDALKQGLDPNGSSGPGTSLQDPSFGCASTRGDGGTGTMLMALVVLLRLAAAQMCRRRGQERSTNDGKER